VIKAPLIKQNNVYPECHCHVQPEPVISNSRTTPIYLDLLHVSMAIGHNYEENKNSGLESSVYLVYRAIEFVYGLILGDRAKFRILSATTF